MEAGELVGNNWTSINWCNIRYDTIIKDFTKQWKALKSRKEEKSPDVPTITKALPVIKWTEAFDDFLSRTVGVQTIPLSYVARENEMVPATCPPLKANKPHSEEFALVELLIW
jgi:hypothetical protein